MCVRTCMRNQHYYSAGVDMGMVLTGSIPNSVNTADYGWSDDALLFYPYMEHEYSREHIDSDVLLPKKCTTPLPDSLPSGWGSIVEVRVHPVREPFLFALAALTKMHSN